MVSLLARGERRRPPRPAGGLRTWISVASRRSSTPSPLGVGEHIRPLGQERAYLLHGPGDWGTVDAEQQPENRVRKVMSQMNERGHHTVDKHQLMPGTGTCRPPPDPAARSVAATLDHGVPRHSQLLDEAAQMASQDPRDQPMREARPINHERHAMITQPTSADTSPTIAHQPAKPW